MKKPIATFEAYRSADGRTMVIEQNGHNVSILIDGYNQHMNVVFTTPSYIEPSNISVTNVVVPEDTTLSQPSVTLAGSSETGDKIWNLAVFYDPSTLVGTSTYLLGIANETFYVTSTYRGTPTNA